MDTKQLLDKFINGEITEVQFDEEKAKLSPEAQEQLKKDSEAKLPDAVEKLKNVRRGIDQIAHKNNEKSADLATKLREENYSAAKQKVFSDLGIEKEEDKTSFEDGFKKFDSGSVNVENIMKDMKAYYASTNSDEYFSLKQDKKKREQEAEEFNAQGSTSGSTQGGMTEEMKKATKEVREFIQAASKKGKTYSVEQAQRAIDIAKRGGHIS